MKIALVTLGCRTNQAETFRLERAIREARHEIVGRPDEADLCIINTCTVTGKADLQSRQVIRRALRKGKRVIATGCFTELNRPEMGDCGGDLTLVPNDKKDDIIKLIGEAQPGKTAVIAKEGRKRPVIKVQDGCDHSCSYCVVPAARGRSRSSAVSDVLSEIALCEEGGYNEIVLSGIHLGMYGRDLDPGETLSSLLENILLRCRIPRIRLSSLEISEIDERLLEVLTNERICRHLHVPLQSGSDIILKNMNRPYTSKAFIDTVAAVHSRFPDMAIGTDIIVGFPGEGPEDFHRTCSVVEMLPFSYLHAFSYSSRPYTRAALLMDQVEGSIKKDRVSELRRLGDLKREAFIVKQTGQVLGGIVEKNTSDGSLVMTGNYIRVFLGGYRAPDEGILVNVRIGGYEKGRAVGYPVNLSEPAHK